MSFARPGGPSAVGTTPAGAPGPPSRPATVVLVIGGPIARAAVPGLCDRARAVVERCGAKLVVCDVGALAPDAGSVEALARLQLTARRLGCEVRLRHASGELQELLALTGLGDVVAVPPVTARACPAGRRAETGSRYRGRS